MVSYSSKILKASWPAEMSVQAFTTLADFGDVRQASVCEKLRNMTTVMPIHLEQVHGNRVLLIENLIEGSTMQQADGLITFKKNFPLLIRTADCLPLFMTNLNTDFVGVVHAGWRGLAQNIIQEAFEVIQSKQKIKPKNILVHFGPAIGPQSFEIGQEVREVFVKSYGTKISHAFQPSLETNKYFGDLYAIARYQCELLGIEKISGGEYCTFKEKKFFSYRRDQDLGRMGNVIWRG